MADPKHGDKTDGTGYLDQTAKVVRNARSAATRPVNLAMVYAYFEVGRIVAEKEQASAARAEYGGHVLTLVSERLTAEFGCGFSRTNVAQMRQLYRVYAHDEIVQMVSEQFGSKLPSKTTGRNFLQTLRPEERALRAISTFKDEYLLDYINVEALGVRDDLDVDERVVERGIAHDIKSFIMEFGRDFAFIGNQYHLEAFSEDQYVDLLFYLREKSDLVPASWTSQWRPAPARPASTPRPQMGRTRRVSCWMLWQSAYRAPQQGKSRHHKSATGLGPPLAPPS